MIRGPSPLCTDRNFSDREVQFCHEYFCEDAADEDVQDENSLAQGAQRILPPVDDNVETLLGEYR